MKILICKCRDCTHWEIGIDGERMFLLCKTCGLEVPILRLEIDDHHMLHWREHQK